MNIDELTVKAIRAENIAINMYLSVPTNKDQLLVVRFLRITRVERCKHVDKFSRLTPGVEVEVENGRFRIFKNTDFVLVGMTEEPEEA